MILALTTDLFSDRKRKEGSEKIVKQSQRLGLFSNIECGEL